MKSAGSVSSFELYPSCPICMDQYDERANRPKVIPCGHTVCLACLESHMNITLKGAPFTCPICRKMPAMPKAGLQGFPDNEALKELLQRPCEEAVQQHVPHCEDHPAEQVEIICVTCKNTKCRECLKQDAINRSTSIADHSYCLDYEIIPNENDKEEKPGKSNHQKPHRFENYGVWATEQQMKLDQRAEYINTLLNEVKVNTVSMESHLELCEQEQIAKIERLKENMLEQVTKWSEDTIQEVRTKHYENKQCLTSKHLCFLERHNELLAKMDSLLNYTVGSLKLIDTMHDEQRHLIRDLTSYQVPRKTSLHIEEDCNKLAFPSLKEVKLTIKMSAESKEDSDKRIRSETKGHVNGLGITLLHSQQFQGKVSVSFNDEILLSDEKIQAMTKLKLQNEKLYPLQNKMFSQMDIDLKELTNVLYNGDLAVLEYLSKNKTATTVFTSDFHQIENLKTDYGKIEAIGTNCIYFREDTREIFSQRWKITKRDIHDLTKSQVLLSGSGKDDVLVSVRATNNDVIILNTNEHVLNILNVHGLEIAKEQLRFQAGSVTVDHDGHIWVAEKGTRNLHVMGYFDDNIIYVKSITIVGYRDLDMKQVVMDETTKAIWATEKFLYVFVVKAPNVKCLKVYSLSKAWHELP